MFKAIAKMFKQSERAARAFQKTISKDQRAYYRQIKKSEKQAIKQEKLCILSLYSDISRMFTKAEKLYEKKNVKAAPKAQLISVKESLENGPIYFTIQGKQTAAKNVCRDYESINENVCIMKENTHLLLYVDEGSRQNGFSTTHKFTIKPLSQLLYHFNRHIPLAEPEEGLTYTQMTYGKDSGLPDYPVLAIQDFIQAVSRSIREICNRITDSHIQALESIMC